MLAFLSAHSVDDLPSRDVISCTSSEDFETAFMKLINGGVLSAPLWDEKEHKFVGFLDTRDLVSLSLVVFDKCKHDADKMSGDGDSLLKHIWTHLKHADTGLTTTYMASRNPFVSIEKGSSLLALVKLLLNLRATRVRRIAVVDSAGKLLNVVSQMNLVQFVAKQLNIVDESHDKVALNELKLTVAECGAGTYPALTIDESATAYDAFKKLEHAGVGGLAVVNASGTITGNISARDIKNFAKNPRIAELKMPVREFLSKLRGEAIDIRMPVIHCLSGTPLRRVVFLFAGTRVHRLFIVDSETTMKPLGVLALSDAIKALFAGAVAEMATD